MSQPACTFGHVKPIARAPATLGASTGGTLSVVPLGCTFSKIGHDTATVRVEPCAPHLC